MHLNSEDLQLSIFRRRKKLSAKLFGFGNKVFCRFRSILKDLNEFWRQVHNFSGLCDAWSSVFDESPVVPITTRCSAAASLQNKSPNLSPFDLSLGSVLQTDIFFWQTVRDQEQQVVARCGHRTPGWKARAFTWEFAACLCLCVSSRGRGSGSSAKSKVLSR